MVLRPAYDLKKIFFSYGCAPHEKDFFFESLKIHCYTLLKNIILCILYMVTKTPLVLDNWETRNEIHTQHGELSLVKYHVKIK